MMCLFDKGCGEDAGEDMIRSRGWQPSDELATICLLTLKGAGQLELDSSYPFLSNKDLNHLNIKRSSPCVWPITPRYRICRFGAAWRHKSSRILWTLNLSSSDDCGSCKA